MESGLEADEANDSALSAQVVPDRGIEKLSGTLRLMVVSPGRIRLEAQGSESGRMRLEASAQAPSGPWKVVSEAVRQNEAADRVSWTLPVDEAVGARFYRWVLPDGDPGTGLDNQ